MYFERLALAFLRNDPVQKQRFSDVLTYSEWAKDNGWTAKDTGIDLVAKSEEVDCNSVVPRKLCAHSIAT